MPPIDPTYPFVEYNNICIVFDTWGMRIGTTLTHARPHVNIL